MCYRTIAGKEKSFVAVTQKKVVNAISDADRYRLLAPRSGKDKTGIDIMSVSEMNPDPASMERPVIAGTVNFGRMFGGY